MGRSSRDQEMQTSSGFHGRAIMSQSSREDSIGQDKKADTDIEPEASVRGSEDVEAAAVPTKPWAAASPPPPALSDVPDGGLDAWLQVLGSWVIMVNTWGLVNSYGVYQTYYETVLLPSQTSSAISWMGSLQAALLMVLGVVSGPLYDAGHLKLLVRAGLFLIVLGMFMTSLCRAYWQVLLAQGFCVGVGMGLVFLPSTAVISQYFRRHRALALGIASSGSPVVGMVFPIIFTHLVGSVGFGWATRVIAFILLGLDVIPVIFMHPRIATTTTATTPQHSPLPEPAETPQQQQQQQEKKKLPPKRRPRFDPSALRDVPYLLIAAASFFAFLTLYVAFFYIQLYAEQLARADSHPPPSLAPYLVTLLNAGSVVGRILPNALADRAGSLNVLLACTGASAALAYAWLGTRGLGGLAAFALLYGGFSGGVLSVLPSVVMAMTPDLSRLGARMAVLFLLGGLSVLCGTPIAGAVLGGASEAEWKGMIGYSAAGLTVATVLLCVSRAILYRKTGKIRQ
ncbi:uncharacterized protein E0L32_011250 [Thyridium curvatum]|uniref:Major facilitator superfamily (MFS) profile domain-containing protein n=1 Tax=Thyridium curvatum TaxID=1093900 RepID=A0A507BNG5_9PEZI|nr:uncharacterized protein E0L32_011250 [Thyridium curvatum]TPX19089.1 hypothetical protein E0L32_011250 [Thyridium curvatum]